MTNRLQWGTRIAAAALLLAGPVAVQAAEKSGMATGEHAFFEEAASGGQMEVELGRVATTHASNQRVKDFGQRMVTDHSKANAELKSLAARKNVTLPGKLSAEDQKQVDRLAGMKGADFDRAYMQMMVDDHEKDVAKFREKAQSATDPDVKTFASKTLPTLESHLRMAKEVESATKSPTAGAREH